MEKPPLTVGRLLGAGFQEVGCWELSDAHKLTCKVELPPQRGVYAFAVDGVVQYVGLASKSVRQRLGHYRTPGPSQTTNIRLNDMICGRIEEGAIVEILVAHPPDFLWKDMWVCGAEGLEAGLIRDFDLPWNVRGSAKSGGLAPSKGRKGITKLDRIFNIVQRRPGLTELEIAKAMFGPAGVQQDVNSDCRLLVQLGTIERLGVGGKGDPFVYRVRK